MHVCVREGLIMSVCVRDRMSAFEREYASKCLKLWMFPLVMWSSISSCNLNVSLPAFVNSVLNLS